mgnify:CR=1 FL=1
MKFRFNNKGLASMMEILGASFVFLIAVFGVVSSISLLTPHSSSAAKRLQAAYLAKDILDELRGQITSTSWADAGSDLAVGTHERTVGDFTVTWTVADVAGGAARQITVEVTYP